MGDVHVRMAITNPRTGAKSTEVTALADTGATLTMIPGSMLERLGIEKVDSVRFVLADGRRTTRRVGHAMVTVNGKSTPCRVVFGRSGDAALLGLTVLEQLGLAVDPVQRRLVPADFRL
jgi:clan AA aspartic protease